MQRNGNDPADTDCVISAANYLEISEFAVFMDSYNAWYGRQASEKQMEKVFSLYLLDNKVPPWVRNYARQKIPADSSLTKNNSADSRIANNLLYIATIIAEYALLASYLVMR